jgi:mitogen-activated protein kinase kinase 7
MSLNLNLTPNATRRRPTPALPIPSLQQQRQRQNPETERRLRSLKTGLLKINGHNFDTILGDLEYLSELGNGTSGNVVKMRHKPSGAIIAVKVSSLVALTWKHSYKILPANETLR